MALNPQDKDALSRYTMAAKKIIYDAGRMEQFMQMLGSKAGALQAVHAVMSIIEKNRPIPPNMAPLLGVNIYMLMVDMAHKVTGEAPDPNIVKAAIGKIIGAMSQSYRKPAQPQGGIIQQKAMA